MEDLLDKDAQLSASLLPCGTKILLEESAVLHFMHMHADDLLEGIEYVEIKRAKTTVHKTKLLGIMKRKTKKYI